MDHSVQSVWTFSSCKMLNSICYYAGIHVKVGFCNNVFCFRNVYAIVPIMWMMYRIHHVFICHQAIHLWNMQLCQTFMIQLGHVGMHVITSEGYLLVWWNLATNPLVPQIDVELLDCSHSEIVQRWFSLFVKRVGTMCGHYNYLPGSNRNVGFYTSACTCFNLGAC